ncbi:hypothetical protein [Klebsiella oxytoca]|uniref:hypothetical protein n=1 Tax=Klebsiella oxytoca TaxID=571 RepID=UPI0007CC7D08|nr:hypothetical protein [Klebsiella oxytoca]SBM18695.1 Uncharacterised protein [Klebsiella oxytoca]
MTDINRLLASLKRRSTHVKKFGDDITFVKLEDIDALVEALEKAQETIAFQQGEIKALLSSLESRTVTVKLPQAVSAGGQGYQEQVERILTAAGIKWEAE